MARDGTVETGAPRPTKAPRQRLAGGFAPNYKPSVAPDNRGGRGRRVLIPDATTLKVLRTLARIQASTREFASALEVSEHTFLKFKEEFPEVADACIWASDAGRVSLRRKQFALASKNAAMAIFLGKNYLGQADHTDMRISGSLTLEHLVLGSIAKEPEAIEGEATAIEDKTAE